MTKRIYYKRGWNVHYEPGCWMIGFWVGKNSFTGRRIGGFEVGPFLADFNYLYREVTK